MDILQTSTLPFSPADHHANDIRVAATSQKVYQLTAYNTHTRSRMATFLPHRRILVVASAILAGGDKGP